MASASHVAAAEDTHLPAAAPTWGVTGKVRYLSQVSREHCAPCRSTERPQGKERGLASDSALGTGPSAKPASRGRNLYGKKKLRQSAGGWRRSTMTEASDEAVLCGRSLHRKQVVTLLKRRAQDGIRKTLRAHHVFWLLCSAVFITFIRFHFHLRDGFFVI